MSGAIGRGFEDAQSGDGAAAIFGRNLADENRGDHSVQKPWANRLEIQD
jgi:hypothetical protein